MSIEVAYRFQQRASTSSLRDLDRVALTAAVESDDGDTIAAGTEGTIVSVSEDCVFYVVEFAEPPGTLATTERHELRRVERTEA